MAANDNKPRLSRLELLLRCSVVTGDLEALAARARPKDAELLHQAVEILRELDGSQRTGLA